MKRRGQLHIAEILIAATILMVFILSIITFATSTTPPPDDNFDEIKTRALNILESADQKKLLRPAIFEYETHPSYINTLAEFISLNLPEYIEFTIYRSEFINSTTLSNEINIYNAGSVPKTSVIQVTYLLSGYYRDGLEINKNYVVSLLLWRQL